MGLSALRLGFHSQKDWLHAREGGSLWANRVRFSAMPTRSAMSKARRRASRRDGQACCGAPKKNGDPCLWEAGRGTDHPGTGLCWKHGGRMQTVGAAADQAASMATAIEVTPGQAIQAVLNVAAGQFAYATAMVGGLDEAQMFEETIAGVVPNRWVRLQMQIMDKLKQYSRAAADMGINERQMQMAEAQTAMMGSLLEAVMDRLELTPGQRKEVGPAIREALPMLMAGNAS